MLIAKLNKKSINYYYSLILHLVKRDFSLKFKRSLLGVLWSLLLPLLQLFILVFVFQLVIPLNIKYYGAFIFCALLPWTWFHTSLSTAGNLFLFNRDLIRRPGFPPFLLIVVNTLSNLVLYIAALPILFLVLTYYNIFIGTTIIYFPIILLIQGSLIIGISLMIAVWNVSYSDVHQLVTVILMLMFYITPIFYGVNQIGESYRFIYYINPMAGIIENYRNIMFLNQDPNWMTFAYSGIISLLSLILGFRLYIRKLHRVFDLI